MEIIGVMVGYEDINEHVRGFRFDKLHFFRKVRQVIQNKDQPQPLPAQTYTNFVVFSDTLHHK